MKAIPFRSMKAFTSNRFQCIVVGRRVRISYANRHVHIEIASSVRENDLFSSRGNEMRLSGKERKSK